jgi:hypothetical protein
MRPQSPFGPDAFQFARAGDRGNEPLDLDHEPQRRAGYIEAAEFEQVIRPGFRYVLEEAGVMNGKRLWSVFRQRTGEERGEPR